MHESSERWLPVPGYEGYYEVSNHGRVRSLDRWLEVPNRWGTTTSYFKPGRVLREKRRKSGPALPYATVTLSIGAVPDTRQVHRLVLEAFIGPCPPGKVSCHGPAGHTDNNLANLRWDTSSENAYDRVRDGNDEKANRETCPRNHALADPNLDPSEKANGHRRCYACVLTQMWGRYRGYRQTDPEWLAEADRRYAEILHFGGPLNYKSAEVRDRFGARQRWQPDAA